MTVATLKKLIAPLDDALEIIVVGPVPDFDGREYEEQFDVTIVAQELDPDTAENHVRFHCRVLEDFPDLPDYGHSATVN